MAEEDPDAERKAREMFLKDVPKSPSAEDVKNEARKEDTEQGKNGGKGNEK